MKNKFYKDFTYDQLHFGYSYMQSEMRHLDFKHPIRLLVLLAWDDFTAGKFSYDGATFVRERNCETIFEVASFVHDWRNSMGFVGRKIDNEFFAIMICLNYDAFMIFERMVKTRLIVDLNYLRHKFWLKDLKSTIPKNLYQEPEIFINP